MDRDVMRTLNLENMMPLLGLESKISLFKQCIAITVVAESEQEARERFEMVANAGKA